MQRQGYPSIRSVWKWLPCDAKRVTARLLTRGVNGSNPKLWGRAARSTGCEQENGFANSPKPLGQKVGKRNGQRLLRRPG